jgi:hypothetical protein
LLKPVCASISLAEQGASEGRQGCGRLVPSTCTWSSICQTKLNCLSCFSALNSSKKSFLTPAWHHATSSLPQCFVLSVCSPASPEGRGFMESTLVSTRFYKQVHKSLWSRTHSPSQAGEDPGPTTIMVGVKGTVFPNQEQWKGFLSCHPPAHFHTSQQLRSQSCEHWCQPAAICR